MKRVFSYKREWPPQIFSQSRSLSEATGTNKSAVFSYLTVIAPPLNKCVFNLQYWPSCTHGPSMHTRTVINLTAAYAVQRLKTILFLAIWCFPGVLFRCKGSRVDRAVKTSCKHNSIPFTAKNIVMNVQPAGNQTATIIIVSGMKPANNKSATNVWLRQESLLRGTLHNVSSLLWRSYRTSTGQSGWIIKNIPW